LSKDKGFVVGVVSSHGHESGHIQVWDVLPEVDAIHVCTIADDADLDAIAALSSKTVSKTKDLDQLLSTPGLDAVAVCVRPDLGPDVLRAAVSAGIPVLFDKPASTSAAAMRAVAELAREKGVTAGGMFQWRRAAQMMEARRMLQGGAFGDLWAVEARVLTSQLRYRRPDTSWLFRKEYAGSGILSWLGCHNLDLLSYITDDRIVEVTAMTGNQNPEKVDVEDTAFVTFRFSSGVMGTLYAGYLMAGPGKNPDDGLIALRGSQGYAELYTGSPWSDSRFDGELSARYSGPNMRMWSEAPGWETGGKRELSFSAPESQVYGGIMAERLFREFLVASTVGAPAPSPIESSVHLLEVVEAAVESSRTGRVVTIPEGPAV
jgi:predicted dehydrogenase